MNAVVTFLLFGLSSTLVSFHFAFATDKDLVDRIDSAMKALNSAGQIEGCVDGEKKAAEAPAKVEDGKASEVSSSCNVHFSHSDLAEVNSLSVKEFYTRYKGEFEALGVHLRFDGDKIVNKDGEIFSPHVWANDLEKNLTRGYSNFEKSKVLSQSFFNHIYPLTKKDKRLNQLFREFIYTNYMFFGSELHSLKQHLGRNKELQLFLIDKSYSTAFENFISEVNRNLKAMADSEVVQDLKTGVLRPMPPRTGRKKIVIVTGSYGGGHISTANAIKSSFKDHPGYEVVEIDECTDIPDTLYLITKRISKCKVYNEYFVKGNFRANILLYTLAGKLEDYLPSNKFWRLHKRIKNESPDLVLSTVHQVPEVMENSYMLTKPLRVVIGIVSRLVEIYG